MEAHFLAMLGHFAKLPTEIRLLIWEALFCLISGKPNHAIEHPQNPLSILCCSRYLYNEIAHHLYKNMKRTFMICSQEPDKPGIEYRIKSRWFKVDRFLDDIQTTQRNIEHFPCAKMRDDSIRVKIQRSSRDDPGKIVLLSERINRFVKALTELTNPPPGRVELTGKWLVHGKVRQSIEDGAAYRCDHDIVLLPFTRLPNWDYILPEDLSALISEEIELSPFTHLSNWEHSLSDDLSNEPTAKRSMLSLLREHGPGFGQHQHRLKTRFGLNDPEWVLEEWLTDTRIFLETNLDFLPGKTAKLLRRRRFAQWYDDGMEFKSQYERHLLADITGNYRILMKYDHQLRQARLRHRWAIYKHHQIQEERYGRPPGGISMCRPWDSHIWATARPDGIEAMSAREILSEEARMVYGFYNFHNEEIAEFSRNLHWWGVDSQEIFERRKPWVFECMGCRELGKPCRCCETWDVAKACRLCREGDFNVMPCLLN